MDNKVRLHRQIGDKSRGSVPLPASVDPHSDTDVDKSLEIAVNLGYFDDMAAEAMEEYRRGEVTDL